MVTENRAGSGTHKVTEVVAVVVNYFTRWLGCRQQGLRLSAVQAKIEAKEDSSKGWQYKPHCIRA